MISMVFRTRRSPSSSRRGRRVRALAKQVEAHKIHDSSNGVFHECGRQCLLLAVAPAVGRNRTVSISHSLRSLFDGGGPD